MAVDVVQEEPKTNVTSDTDDNGKTRFTSLRVFNVTVTDAADTEQTVLSDPQIPKPNDTHPRLGTAYRCVNVQITQVSPLLYQVTCTYETHPIDQGGTGGAQEPWNQRAVIEYFTVRQDVPADEDFDGVPYGPSTGETVDGLMRTFVDLGIRITKPFLSFSPPIFYTFNNTTNSKPWQGWPKGVLRVMDIAAPEAYFQNMVYHPVTVEIHARKPYRTSNEKAWYRRVLQQGFYYRPTASAAATRALDPSTKEAMVRPVFLNLDGTRVPDGGLPVWFEHKEFEERDYDEMGLF